MAPMSRLEVWFDPDLSRRRGHIPPEASPRLSQDDEEAQELAHRFLEWAQTGAQQPQAYGLQQGQGHHSASQVELQEAYTEGARVNQELAVLAEQWRQATVVERYWARKLEQLTILDTSTATEPWTPEQRERIIKPTLIHLAAAQHLLEQLRGKARQHLAARAELQQRTSTWAEEPLQGPGTVLLQAPSTTTSGGGVLHLSQATRRAVADAHVARLVEWQQG